MAQHISDLSDLCSPWCIHVVVTLRVAEYITAGINTIDGLAEATHCNTYALHRILTYLVGKGVFEEPTPGHFAMNDIAQELLDPGMRIGLDLDGIGGRFAHAWGTLLPYVRTGVPAYAQVFGLPFWQDLDAHPDLAASFDALIGLTGHGTPDANFQITDGWESVRTVVDVGGGTGALLGEILRLHPHIRGTLVDQPGTVLRSAETFRLAGVSERVTTIGQSFFDPLPAGADVYVLKGILNDWPDHDAAAILRRCAEAARPNGRVVILGGVVHDNTPRALTIEMVLVGGKYRSVTEMRELTRECGLEVLAADLQATGYFVVECYVSI
jgi:hypothetical protein